MAEVHIGETGKVIVRMKDANGNETDSYDKMSGVTYTSTHPGMVDVVDADAEPKDAELSFSALTPTGEDAFINVSFDGDPGDGVRQVALVSEAIHVVPGDAVAGTVEIVVTPVA